MKGDDEYELDLTNPKFDGDDYVPERDNPRLKTQIKRIFMCMSDGKWRTLSEIEKITNDPAASISAQLRHLRKEKFGSHTIEKRHRGDESKGLYEYRLTINYGGDEPEPMQHGFNL